MIESSLPIVLEGKGLSKSYTEAKTEVRVLNQVDLQIRRGEIVALIGASGSGKSTLLHLLGLLDQASAGEVLVAGRPCQHLDERTRSRIRNEHLGFVYQFHHLLPEFSALENVAMPLIIRRQPRADALRQATVMLERVGLQHRLKHHPGQLSGGERQRVALARALVTNPSCVLADEPTGNLDQHTAQEVFDLLRKLNQELGMAFLIVTHDTELAAKTDRQLRMVGGSLV
ncbi:MAG: lipoprotein-releasing ABC transporter ATP-binding protein LolD [Pigmentiphaga sp.]|nr:lipoprotein-releasing ABC transporter ATP-binding protein LolD [Pigmentiphaga sp.]